MLKGIEKYALGDLLHGCEGGYDGMHELLYRLQAEEIGNELDSTSKELARFKELYGDSEDLDDRWHIYQLERKIEETYGELLRVRKECKRYTARVKKARKVM